MSRSRKKAIVRAGSGEWRKLLRRKVKRHQRNFLKNNLLKIATGEKVIPDDKTIVNDYDYCDYKIDYEHDYTYDSFWNKYATDENFNKYKKKSTRK